jgi:PAS domain S-box-containing protein
MRAMLVDLLDVRRALETEALVPCFQPIVELRTGFLAGFEALARWEHPDHGLILPENLISLAEENGLIGQLTHQILGKAFLAAPMLPEPLFLAVNVSSTQLHHLTLPRQIRNVAEEYGFPLQRLIVEITENALVNNLERARKIAIELREMGCKLALDDFGTGYSSLVQLQALPFSVLKVDRSFVQSMTQQRESRKIVAAVVGLGYSLGMITVGEGVETEEQADMLLWLGCELAQGWLYGRPLAAERIPDMVAATPLTFYSTASREGKEGEIFSLEALPAQRLAQLQAIYHGAPVGLCFLDTNLRYVSINQRLADMNGASVAAHIGKTVEEMIPELFPQVQPYILRALQGEAIADMEAAKPSPNFGEPDMTVLLSYQPAFDEAQEVIGISVAVMDISERKLAEDALRESSEDYRHLVEVSPQMAWVRDADLNMTDVSSRWLQLTGMSKEQASKLGWMDALHPDDLALTMKSLREALHSGKPIDVEYRVMTADGTWRWLRSRGAPRYGPAGEILRWYGGWEDIEERKELEEALRKSRVRK